MGERSGREERERGGKEERRLDEWSTNREPVLLCFSCHQFVRLVEKEREGERETVGTHSHTHTQTNSMLTSFLTYIQCRGSLGRGLRGRGANSRGTKFISSSTDPCIHRETMQRTPSLKDIHIDYN